MGEIPYEVSIAIDSVKKCDAEEILHIYNHYVRTSIATFQEEDAALNDICNKILIAENNGMPFLVAREASTDAVCGYAYGSHWNQRSAYRFAAEASIYLHPDRCGRGLGKRLLLDLLCQLREMGKQQVLVSISVEPGQDVADSQSCRLHSSVGFKQVGRLPKVGIKFGRWLDVAIM